MSDYIPNQILFIIFQKLPAISLIRCSSVCKSWNSIIINPIFITDHLKRVNSPDHSVKNEKIVLRASVDNGREIGLYSLSCDNSCDNQLKLHRARTSFQNVEIVGTSSGLVCLLLVLKNGEVDRIVIWNPYIKKAVSILCAHRSLQRRMLYGFFVHPTTQEYKVVAFPCKNNVNEAPHNVEIYRQDLGDWNGIDAAVPCFITSSGATVNGVVHWLVTEGTNGHNSIVLFDMHTEAFSEMCVPPSVVRKSFLFLGVAFSSDSLVLYETCPERANNNSSYSVIWVMKEYGDSESWSKLFSIEMPGMWLTPLGVRMNGEVLLTTSTGNSLVCYDPVTNGTTSIAIDGIVRSPANTYVESLLLMDVNGASEKDSFGEFCSDN